MSSSEILSEASSDVGGGGGGGDGSVAGSDVDVSLWLPSIVKLRQLILEENVESLEEALREAGLPSGADAPTLPKIFQELCKVEELCSLAESELAELLEAVRCVLLRRLTRAGLRHRRIVFLLGRFQLRLDKGVFNRSFHHGPGLVLPILQSFWKEKILVHATWKEHSPRLEVLRRLVREFSSRLAHLIPKWSGLEIYEGKVSKSEPEPSDYEALGGETEEAATVELIEDLADTSTLVAVAELWSMEEELVLRIVGREWEEGAEAVLKGMETVDWNFEDLDLLAHSGCLLGLSGDVRERMPRVLKFATDMVDIRPAAAFTDVMAAAYECIPGGLPPRIAFFQAHFRYHGSGFNLNKFAGDGYKDRMTQLLNSLHSGSIGAGEADPRHAKLAADLLWFSLLNPRSATLTILTTALEKDFLLPPLASLLRALRPLAEWKEDGCPLGLAAAKRLMDKSPELVLADGTGDAFVSLLCQLCRRGAESEPFIQPSTLLLTFLCPAMEKERGALLPLYLKLFARLVKHRDTPIIWSMRDPGAEAWEGVEASAPEDRNEVQFVIVLELLMKVWARAADLGRQAGRTRQLAFKCVRALLGELGKKLSGRLDPVCVSWLTQDRLNSFQWQYKAAILDWLPQVAAKEVNLELKEIPSCLHDFLDDEEKDNYVGITCPGYRGRGHREDASGRESCALDSILELFVIWDAGAMELTEKAAARLSRLDCLEEKLTEKIGEKLLKEECLESPAAIKGLLQILATLHPSAGKGLGPAELAKLWRGSRGSCQGAFLVGDEALVISALSIAVDKVSANAGYYPGEFGFQVKTERAISVAAGLAQVCKESAEALEERVKAAESPRSRELRREEESAALFILFAKLGLLVQSIRKLPGAGAKDQASLQLCLQHIARQARTEKTFEFLCEPVKPKPCLPPAPAEVERKEESHLLPSAQAAKNPNHHASPAPGPKGDARKVLGLGRGKLAALANGLTTPTTAEMVANELGTPR